MPTTSSIGETTAHRPGRGMAGGPLVCALIFVWIGVGAVALFIALHEPAEIPLLEALLRPLQAHVPSDKAMYSPLAYFCLLSIVFLLERLIPARQQQILTANLALDLCWYFITIFFRVTLLAAYGALLFAFYQRYLSALTLEAAMQWHPALRFVVAVLATDFFRWLSHLIIHKVPAFWAFHALHHSQRELNLFTDARVHPVDRIVSATVKFVPALMLSNSFPVIIAWAIFETLYPKFYHANLRLNLGPLRYVLVTPQSHRVHHGVAPQYRDRNFGFTFSIWDWIFGTQYRGHTVYPETGVADEEFPVQRLRGPTDIPHSLGRQLLHPFTVVFGRNGR